MPRQIDRKEAERILRLRKHWGEKSRLAEELGIKLCSVSNWLRGRGGLSLDKVAVILGRAFDLKYGLSVDSLTSEQRANQQNEGSVSLRNQI